MNDDELKSIYLNLFRKSVREMKVKYGDIIEYIETLRYIGICTGDGAIKDINEFLIDALAFHKECDEFQKDLSRDNLTELHEKLDANNSLCMLADKLTEANLDSTSKRLSDLYFIHESHTDFVFNAFNDYKDLVTK